MLFSPFHPSQSSLLGHVATSRKPVGIHMLAQQPEFRIAGAAYSTPNTSSCRCLALCALPVVVLRARFPSSSPLPYALLHEVGVAPRAAAFASVSGSLSSLGKTSPQPDLPGRLPLCRFISSPPLSSRLVACPWVRAPFPRTCAVAAREAWHRHRDQAERSPDGAQKHRDSFRRRHRHAAW